MENNCLSTICCDDSSTACFVQVCDERAKVDSTIAALMIIENGEFPSVGDTVTLTVGGTVVLTSCNYNDTLIKWFRERQLQCTEHGVYYYFMHTCLISKGVRPKSTFRYNENGCQYGAKPMLGYDNTATFDVDNYLPNAGSFSSLMKSGGSFSVAYLFKQGIMVMNSEEDYMLSVTDADFDITGDASDYIRGSFSIVEKGKKSPEFYPSENPVANLRTLKDPTEFEFGALTVTGLVAAACAGKCSAYTIAPAIAFTVTPVLTSVTSCVVYDLYATCSDPVVGVEIDSNTGVITAATGLASGKYKFTIKASNSCCVTGTQCFTVDIA